MNSFILHSQCSLSFVIQVYLFLRFCVSMIVSLTVFFVHFCWQLLQLNVNTCFMRNKLLTYLLNTVIKV